MASVRVHPIGGLNKDIDPQYINKGDYTDALNVRSITANGGTTLSKEPVKGNELKVTLPTIATQNQKFKLTFATSDNTPYEAVISIINSSGAFASSLSHLFDSGDTYAQFKNMVADAIEADEPGAFIFSNLDSNDNIMYIEADNNAEYTITGDDNCVVEQTQESLSGVDLTGLLVPLKSLDIDGDLYLISTCCDSESRGYGEIGVQTYNASTDVFTYTTLLGSKELALSTRFPITSFVGERSDSKDSLYLTDATNPVRAFYYKGDFISQGALTVNNADGYYAFGSIASELSLYQAAMNTTIEVGEQLQLGYNLPAGNWRYSVRLLTEQLAETPFLPITNPVPVFAARTDGEILDLKGSEAGELTGKANQLIVSEIDTELFRYVELLGIHYSGKAQTAYIISRTNITAESMTLLHAGNENGTREFDMSELLKDYDGIDTAACLAIIDNRLLQGDLTMADELDLQDIADGITLTTMVYDLEGSGNVNQPAFVADGTGHDHAFVLGEYQVPDNCVRYVGYQHYEKYFAGIRFHRKNGTWTRTYPIGEIQITPEDYNLTDNAYNHTVKVAYIEAGNIDISSVSDLVIGFSIVVAELVPEVLATGIALLGIEDSGTIVPTTDFYSSSPSYDTNPDANRNYALFYSPDILNNNTAISYQVGDQLIVLGSPSRPTDTYDYGAGGFGSGTTLAEFSGYVNASTNIDIHDISETADIAFDNEVTLGGLTFKTNPTAIALQRGIAIQTSTELERPTGNTYDDFGMYYCWYYRPNTGKYNNPENLKYNSTGHYYAIQTGDTIIGTQAIFGGDTYTQGYYLHVGYNRALGADTASGVRFFSQNKGNMQLRDYPGAPGYLFPGDTLGDMINDKIGNWLDDLNSEVLSYNQGYNVRNRAQLLNPYNPNLEYVTRMPARITYSALKPQNSTKDFYRTFLPLNFKDEELSDGAITRMEVLNGELFTWQPRALRKQYFNTRGLVKSEDGTEILLGDGSVFAQKSVKLSSYGCKHRFGVVKVKTDGGADGVHWINTENKKWMRFGADGTVALSDRGGMQSFLANNLKWADIYDNPFYEGGIHGVWNSRFGEIIFTFRAKRAVDLWLIMVAYPAGSLVRTGETGSFEKTENIYRSLTHNTSFEPTANPAKWELVPHTDSEHYNEYTLVFNEFENKFSTFFSCKPKAYFQWKDSYLSAHPQASYQNQMYKHDEGEYCVWYDNGTVEQEEQGYVEMVMNEDTNQSKTFYNLAFNTESTPYYVNLYTKEHESYVEEADFLDREGQFICQIKNDILTSEDGATNDEDTSRLWGMYLKARMCFEPRAYNKLYNYITTYRENFRPTK